MIRLFRRAARPPESPGHRGVVVVDGTPHGVGEPLCTALRGHGVSATAIDPFEVTAAEDVAVLLLPLAAGTLPHTATTALSVLGRVSADPAAAADFRGRFVVVWYLPQARRRRLAAVGAGQLWNASELLLASSWRRELRHHDGDEVAATRCRSDRVARMVEARSHHRLGANTAPQVLRDLRRLDPDLVQGVCVEVAEDGALRWTGAAAVAAAARVRAVNR